MPEKLSKQQFLTKAQERFDLTVEAESEPRSLSLDDWNFSIGDQWPSDIRTARINDGRPCLTMNRLPTFIAQITNDQRQQRPAIRVNPVGNGADKDTAEILQGIIRHIEVRSDAEIARDTAFEGMVTGGIAYYRILTEWDGKEFGQELCIATIINPFSVYMDPSAVKSDRSDARFCFITEDLTEEQYKEKYPDSELASLSDWWTALGNSVPGWLPNGGVRVAEYFYIEEKKTKIYELASGQTVEALPKGEKPTNERERIDRKVMWAKINGIEIMQEREWQGEYIPVIPVIGRESYVDGKRTIMGLVRSMKDPQRQYNYFQSASTEAIALAPKAPWLMAEGQDEGYEQIWARANVANFSTLHYKPKAFGADTLPPPQRISVEPPIQAMTLMVKQADGDMKAISGLYDPSLGQNKEEQSGKAVMALQRQGQVSNVNWIDNLSRSIRYEGRQLIDLIRKVYTVPKVQRIIAPDGTNSHVVIHNGPDQAAAAQALLTDKITRIYDIGVGDYDVAISVGPSYQSKRQEAVASIMSLVASYPPLMQIAGDLLLQNMDIPGAEEISERFKKMLPPQVLEGDDPQSQMANAQAQIQALHGQLQQATQLLQQQHEIIQTKQVESAAKVQITEMQESSKRQITEMQEANKLAIAEVTTKAQEPITRMKYEFEMWKELHGSAHEVGIQAEDQQHEQALATQQQAAQQQAAAQAAQQQPEQEPASIGG